MTDTDTIIIDIGGDKVEVFYADTPRGIMLDCLAYIHPHKDGDQGRQEELEDLMPNWHDRQDLKDRIHRGLYESR